MTTPQHETMNSGPVLGKMDEDGIFSAGDTPCPHVQHHVSCCLVKLPNKSRNERSAAVLLKLEQI